jgi:hypothetical protein
MLPRRVTSGHGLRDSDHRQSSFYMRRDVETIRCVPSNEPVRPSHSAAFYVWESLRVWDHMQHMMGRDGLLPR